MIKKLKDNKIFRIVNSVLKALVSFVIILIVTTIFIQRVSNNRVTLGGYSIFTIASGSMVPKYEIGDMVFVKKVDPSKIEIGDDVVYLGKEKDFKDKIVTHAVISKKQEDGKYKFQTRGISNDIADPEISEDQIYGVVIYKGILISLISKLVNNIYGFYFIVFVPLTIIVFLEIIAAINERKKLK